MLLDLFSENEIDVLVMALEPLLAGIYAGENASLTRCQRFTEAWVSSVTATGDAYSIDTNDSNLLRLLNDDVDLGLAALSVHTCD